MATTRQKTKDKLNSIINALKNIDIMCIEIGMLYQESDVILSGVMYAVSLMVETVLPLVEQANNEL